MSERIVYRYTPRNDGAFIGGLPRRDLFESDLPSIAAWDLKNGVDCGIYQPVSEPNASLKDAKKPEKAEVTE